MSVLHQVGVGEPLHDPGSDEVSVVVGNGSRTMVEALRRLDDAGVCVLDATVVRPTLDDVFLSLTGTPAEPIPEPETDDVQEEVLS